MQLTATRTFCSSPLGPPQVRSTEHTLAAFAISRHLCGTFLHIDTDTTRKSKSTVHYRILVCVYFIFCIGKKCKEVGRRKHRLKLAFATWQSFPFAAFWRFLLEFSFLVKSKYYVDSGQQYYFFQMTTVIASTGHFKQLIEMGVAYVAASLLIKLGALPAIRIKKAKRSAPILKQFNLLTWTDVSSD